MMNFVWSGIIIVSVLYGIFSGNGISVGNAVIQSAESSAKLLITLCGSMALWSGIMNVAEHCGITDNLRVLLSPVLKFLFPKYRDNPSVMNAVSTNITANMIGIGNASTPAGLRATAGMYSGKNYADRNLSVFVVMNTASIQLIPTTIATIRTAHGSKAPMEITLCIWISSLIALITGIVAVWILFGKDTE